MCLPLAVDATCCVKLYVKPHWAVIIQNNEQRFVLTDVRSAAQASWNNSNSPAVKSLAHRKDSLCILLFTVPVCGGCCRGAGGGGGQACNEVLEPETLGPLWLDSVSWHQRQPGIFSHFPHLFKSVCMMSEKSVWERKRISVWISVSSLSLSLQLCELK